MEQNVCCLTYKWQYVKAAPVGLEDLEADFHQPLVRSKLQAASQRL